MVQKTPCLARFLADQKGAVTIEFTTLVPFFIFLMVFFVDASMIYLSHSEMYSTARDIARRMSTGELKTAQEVEDYAAEHLFLGLRNYYIDRSYVDGAAQVRIAVGIGEAAIFGAFFKPILGKALVATAVAKLERPLVPNT